VRTDKPQTYVQTIANNKVLHHVVKTGLRGQLLGQTDNTVWVEVSGVPSNSMVLRGTAGALREGMAVRSGSTPSPASSAIPSSKP
jgi:hypothetical protein